LRQSERERWSKVARDRGAKVDWKHCTQVAAVDSLLPFFASEVGARKGVVRATI
jgi:hypothetical protein